MVITLPRELQVALTAQARRQGIEPEALALDVLGRQLFPTPPVPIDEWERQLFGTAIDCGVSVSNFMLSSDGLYE